jgi:hypothetical protein
VRGPRSIRAIIVCAGRGRRWNAHGGVPKHAITIDGERLIDRTVRMLRASGVDDIWTTSESALELEGTRNLTSRNALATGSELDRFYNAIEAWQGVSELAYFYGDTYYSEACVASVLSHHGDFRAVGRAGPSSLTGKECGELFGFMIRDFKLAFDALETVYLAQRRLLFARMTNRSPAEPWTARTIGWEWYRQVEGFPLRIHGIGPRFLECDDWTEDFDEPEDLERWSARRENAQARDSDAR